MTKISYLLHIFEKLQNTQKIIPKLISINRFNQRNSKRNNFTVIANLCSKKNYFKGPKKLYFGLYI